MQEKVCRKKHRDVSELREQIVESWNQLDQSIHWLCHQTPDIRNYTEQTFYLRYLQ